MKISVLGLGTWQWGDRVFWGYGYTHDDSDIRDAFVTSLAAGINFFDTAEVYGLGKSERFLGRFVNTLPYQERKKLVIGTKFAPFPYRLSKSHLNHALSASLKRLGFEQVHLYQVHWPYSFRSVETWAEGLGEAIQSGLIRAAGVSNYNSRQLQRAWKVLEDAGGVLASNQVEYHLLNRSAEKTGLLSLCQESGITLIAYSPLAKGLLTGKYTPNSRPAGFRSGFMQKDLLERIQPLIGLLREIGAGHNGKTPAQVALNWIICKGAVAIPGAKNQLQAQENAGAMGWRLSTAEVYALDRASDEVRA